MRPFPYFEILQQAWTYTRRRPWLWIFGFFAGGTAGINFGGFNYVFSPPTEAQVAQAEAQWGAVVSWIQFHSLWFTVIVALVFVVSGAMIVLAGISRGALVWAGGKFSEDERVRNLDSVDFIVVFRQGRAHFWRIVGLQVLTTLAFLAMFALYLTPVIYLFAADAVNRAVFLSFFGLLIFIPAGITLSFMHLYGPIFLVVYGVNISSALQYSFNLFRQKFVESLLFALLLLVTSFGFGLILLFSLVLLGLPLLLCAYLLLRFGFLEAALVWAAGSGILLICYTIVMGAAFAVFQNFAWVIAVRQMLRTVNLKKEEEAVAPEPA